MKTISATIIVFSGALCIAGAAGAANKTMGGWAMAAGIALAGVGMYVWAAMIGWISPDWASSIVDVSSDKTP